MILKIALFVLTASFPPFKITALEDFIARAEIWEITSGRASKMIPKTPIGHEIFVRINPSSSCLFSRTFPTGFSSFDISSMPCIISRILLSSSFNLLKTASDSSPLLTRFLANSKSFLLASKILSLYFSKFSAMLIRALFLISSLITAIFLEASFAFIAISRKLLSSISIFLT